MKKALVFLLILHNSLQSQELSEQEQMQIDFAIDLFYADGSKIFVDGPLYYTKKTVDTPLFLAQLPPKQVLKNTLAAYGEIAKLEFDGEGMMHSLNVVATLENIDWPLPELFQISLVGNKLLDAQGQAVALNDQISTSHTYFTQTQHENGENKIYKTLQLSSGMFFTEDHVDTPKGDLSFQLDLISGYETVKIGPQDTGKKFSFLGVDYTVIGIRNNYVIIHPDHYDHEKGFPFKVMHLDTSNKAQFTELSYDEIEARKEAGEVFDNDVLGMGTGMLSIPQNMYKIFESEPKISKADFKKKAMPLLLASLAVIGDAPKMAEILGPTYIVIQDLAPIEQLYLYAPKSTESLTITKALQ
ncbi:hypothetical protein [Sediminicola luteus]|uniref:Uncharacterized protein n=1 Tax=Sediminicola luteus TaxID=319238 RepID=A0A2A4GCS4_9FLAO|nr:hypothetical protein [Sediminicola luteus]PCE66221.1 hypothetical protein B7P33_02670 [Sediminicola luteus]